MPQLVPAVVAPRGVLAWKGTDPLKFKRDGNSDAVSAVVHLGIIALVLWWGIASHRQILQTAQTVVTPVDFKLFAPPPPVMKVAQVEGGGGGGGARQITPPTQAPMPKVTVPHQQLLPPQIVRVSNPKLAAEPNMQLAMVDNSAMPKLGDPDSPQVALVSQGSGNHAGIGIGMGGGLGSGKGAGVGAGANGGFGGGLMTVGGGVSAPTVIHSVEPEFTEEARHANLQGTVSIQLIVDAQGNPQDIRVTKHLGMGLDEKAIAAVRQYKFKPAMYQGNPVAVQLVIDVDFRLH